MSVRASMHRSGDAGRQTDVTTGRLAWDRAFTIVALLVSDVISRPFSTSLFPGHLVLDRPDPIVTSAGEALWFAAGLAALPSVSPQVPCAISEAARTSP